MGMPAGEEKRFTVARGSKIAHTVGIETIEYGQAQVWRAVRARASSPCGRLRRVIPALQGEGLD
jgi:hypothetical protein